MHERLSGVVIERLPFHELIPRYDMPRTLFYLDPPYWGCESDYGPVFRAADFTRLSHLLASIQGTFVMSINDVPEIRERFPQFELLPVHTSYSISGDMRPAAELLIVPKGQTLRRLL